MQEMGFSSPMFPEENICIIPLSVPSTNYSPHLPMQCSWLSGCKGLVMRRNMLGDSSHCPWKRISRWLMDVRHETSADVQSVQFNCWLYYLLFSSWRTKTISMKESWRILSDWNDIFQNTGQPVSHRF
jgi:hypothetical protein